MPTEWYVIDEYSGYSPVTGRDTDTVYCIEARVGAYPYHPDYTTYAIAQVFWDEHPNVALTALITLDAAGKPVGEGIYNKEIDRQFSMVFLPVIYRAFNTLDPHNGLRSQIVQRYTNTRVLLQDFIPASLFTFRLLLAATFTGQQATIAGDFSDFLTRVIAGVMMPFVRGKRISLIVATKDTSRILVPTRNRSDVTAPPYTMQSSTALDQCFEIARQTLERPQTPHA